jgi:hypothetical protein
MNTEFIQEEQASSFLEEFLAGKPAEAQPQGVQPPSGSQSILDSILGKTQQATGDSTTDDPALEESEEKTEEEKKEGEEKTVEELLKDKKEEKVEEVKVPETLFERLKEEGLAFEYEDGTKPQTLDEIAHVLKESRSLTIQKEIEEAWNSKVQALSPQIQTILKYAESGVATATDLNNLISQVSYYEKISELDPKNPEHQEQIVYIHLLNTGLSEQEATEQLNVFKESKSVEKVSEKFYPSLKKTYEAEIRRNFEEQQAKEEMIDAYVQTNAVNVQYFLQNEQAFVPFKLSKDHKVGILELAAKPIAIDPTTNDPVFAYQEYLKGLQSGTEEQYKEFMEIMAFIANKKAYKEKFQSQVSSKTNEKNFKKIMIPEGKASNQLSDEDERDTKMVIRKSNSPWSI